MGTKPCGDAAARETHTEPHPSVTRLDRIRPVVWNDAAYGAEVNLYGLKGLAEGPMRIPEVDFAGLATAVGAEGVVVRELADLDRLATWSAEPVDHRRFLLLDCRISGDVIAPYQQEIIRANS